MNHLRDAHCGTNVLQIWTNSPLKIVSVTGNATTLINCDSQWEFRLVRLNHGWSMPASTEQKTATDGEQNGHEGNRALRRSPSDGRVMFAIQ